MSESERNMMDYMVRTNQSQLRVGDKLVEIHDGRLVMRRIVPRIEPWLDNPPTVLSAPRIEPPRVPVAPLSQQPRFEQDEPTEFPDLICCVCMENKKVIAGGQCGHRLCMSCSRRITETTRLCPECRKPWTNLLRVY